MVQDLLELSLHSGYPLLVLFCLLLVGVDLCLHLLDLPFEGEVVLFREDGFEIEGVDFCVEFGLLLGESVDAPAHLFE